MADSTSDAAPRASALLPVAALTVLALGLRLYQIDSQLWIDEIAAVCGSLRRPVLDIMSEWPDASSHVFFEVLAGISLHIFGESPFAIRLPAALFGVASVIVLYRLGARLFDRTNALVISGLVAVSYHHVFHSQNARGYTTLIFFYLAATLLFIRMHGRERLSRRDGFLYALTVTLATYSQPFGVFIPVAHFVVVVADALFGRRRGRAPAFPLKTFVGWTVAAGVATLLLYVPFIPSMKKHMDMNVATEAEGPRLSLALFAEMFEGLSAGFFGPAGVIVAAAVGLAAFLVLARRHPVAVTILLLPIVFQALAFIAMGVGIHPRYFAIALPMLFITRGFAVTGVVTFLVGRLLSRNRRRPVAGLVLTLLVAASAWPLAGYYRYPKQDFAGAYAIVEAKAETGDLRIGVHMAGSALILYYDQHYIMVDRLEPLLAEESKGRRIWLVTTLEGLVRQVDAKLLEHVHETYRFVKALPGTLGDGTVRIYVREKETSSG